MNTESSDRMLTVILPAYNEELVIADVVNEVRDSLSDWDGPWEVLVVDDGSTDRTIEFALAAGARVARREENGGYGAAVKTGIAQSQSRLLALIDADGSYKPADFRQLLSTLCGKDKCGKDKCGKDNVRPAAMVEFDLVNGVRSQEHGPWRNLRWLVKNVIRKLAEWFSGRRIPDLNTGMKVFRREAALAYLWALPDGFSCSTSMTLALLCDGRAVQFVPVEYRPRVGRSKFRPVRDTAKYLATVIRVVLYFRPLRVLFPLAILFAALATTATVSRELDADSELTAIEVILGTLSVAVLIVGIVADGIAARRRSVP